MSALLFVPEELTPLYFTPIYATLSREQQVAYNRLHGLYFLEQTIFFEQFLGLPGLRWMERHAPTPELQKEARDFIAEEDTHSGWFRTLLREIDPQTYTTTDFHLLGASAFQQSVTRRLSAGIAWLPALLWLQLMAEERALHFGRCFVRHADTMDPRFLEVQRRHLADEPGHIRRDLLFLDWLWPSTPPWLRRLNARFLHWLLREFFLLPKRSGKNVVLRWLDQNPELQALRPTLLAQWDDLQNNPTFLNSLYPRKALPKTAELASRWPEMKFMDHFLTACS